MSSLPSGGPTSATPLVDLHCHILPGVDDGAVDLHESRAMAADAMREGCTAVVATSHLWENLFDTSPQLLREEYAHVISDFGERGVGLEVLPGAENFLGADVPADEFVENAVPLAPAARYVLLDFSLRTVPPRLSDVITALRARGRTPVIAHPERNLELQRDPAPVAEWIAEGAVIQVNAPSLLGMLGSAARSTGELLVSCGAAHVLASDAHNRRGRPFCLGRGREAAEKLIGPEEADRMVNERPWKIVRGEAVETAPVEIARVSGPRRFLRRLLDPGR